MSLLILFVNFISEVKTHKNILLITINEDYFF